MLLVSNVATSCLVLTDSDSGHKCYGIVSSSGSLHDSSTVAFYRVCRIIVSNSGRLTSVAGMTISHQPLSTTLNHVHTWREAKHLRLLDDRYLAQAMSGVSRTRTLNHFLHGT